MNRCETCKHWSGWRKVHRDGMGQCHTAAKLIELYKRDRNGPEEQAWLKTPADFGCTLHEQKDGEK